MKVADESWSQMRGCSISIITEQSRCSLLNLQRSAPTRKPARTQERAVSANGILRNQICTWGAEVVAGAAFTSCPGMTPRLRMSSGGCRATWLIPFRARLLANIVVGSCLGQQRWIRLTRRSGAQALTSARSARLGLVMGMADQTDLSSTEPLGGAPREAKTGRAPDSENPRRAALPVLAGHRLDLGLREGGGGGRRAPVPVGVTCEVAGAPVPVAAEARLGGAGARPARGRLPGVFGKPSRARVEERGLPPPTPPPDAAAPATDGPRPGSGRVVPGVLLAAYACLHGSPLLTNTIPTLLEERGR